MKKNIYTLFFILILAFTYMVFSLILSGCSKYSTNTDLNSSQQQRASEGQISDKNSQDEALITPNPSFDIKFIQESNERPIAVMIDNDDPSAWPHAGLEDAYVIYETIVEGGSTRFMALFKGMNSKKIGPIRSSRHYFLDYVMENDAIYVHFGWSPKAIKDISTYNISKINGVLGGDDRIFWREPKRKFDYHDVYTSISNVRDMTSKKKYRDTSTVKNFLYVPSNEVELTNGATANKITIPYSRYHTTHYEYDEATSLYKRWMRGRPHMLSTTNGQICTKNIIIQFVKNYSLNDGAPKIGRQQLDTVGSGKGYYITNGRSINITWKKQSRESKTFYLDEKGNEIALNDGQTWIQITPAESSVIIE